MSTLASAFWPRFYRLLRLFDPLIEPIWRHIGLGNTVRVTIVGRHSGRPRSVYLGLLRVAERSYLGHPDVDCAWTRNLEAAGGEGTITDRRGRTEVFRAIRLRPGPEREAVIRATFRQHPFPGSVLYWLARHHIRTVGCFYRLEAA